jgi:protein-disulfide isomerase
VKIVFRDFPLANHPRALPAAEAALCAKEQGKFWEYHDQILANQRKLADEDLKGYAEALGMNVETFSTCVEGSKFEEEAQKDLREGQEQGVTGTPAFFINGRFLSGAQPFDAFKSIIDQELEE